MSCDCVEYACLGIAPRILQCGDEITTTLLSNETAVWLMEYEFNGRWVGVQLTVTANEVISLPDVFNESYTHRIKLYNSGSDLFNSTCYELDTRYIVQMGGQSSPIQPGVQGTYITVAAADDGTTIEVPAGVEVWLIFPGNQGWVRNIDFTQSGNIVTIINGSTVTGGQTYLMLAL